MTTNDIAALAEEGQAREARLKPMADQLIAQFNRGLLTTMELSDELMLLIIEDQKVNS